MTVRTLREIYPDSPLASRPLGIRVNDTIYAAGLAGVDLNTGELPPDVDAQMRLILEQLKTLVEGAGASLDNVARCAAYVTTAQDRASVEALWTIQFPNEQDKPAFKIMATDLPAGQLVRLDVLALVGGRRERLDLPNVSAHYPTIKMGNWVFSGRVHGTSPTDGEVVPGGLGPEAAQTMENLVSLVELGGGTKDDIVQISTFGRDTSYIPGARKAFEAMFPDPGRRPAFHPMLGEVRRANAMMAEVVAVMDGGGSAGAGEMFEELFLSPETVNLAIGAKLGSLVYAPDVTGIDPATGQLVGPGTGEQIQALVDNVDAVMKAAGGGAEHLARVHVFMADIKERYDTLNPIWRKRFPDGETRPPHSHLPAQLPAGQGASAQVFGLLGAPRRSLYVDGLVHGDGMTLAVAIGNLVMSARVFAGESENENKDPVENTRGMFANLLDILNQAGGSLDNLQQLFVSLHDPDHRGTVQEMWSEVGGGSRDVPFRFVDWDMGRGMLPPRCQMIAVI